MSISALFWWIRQVILSLAACFFLLFGVQVLISAYGLNDPFLFIMTFFSSNLIILISAVMLIAFILKMIKYKRDEAEKEEL